MEEFGKEYYQQMIRSDTHESHWTQFELDLIRCVRDDYPVIYTKVGEMTRHQRAGKIRIAWKQISRKFQELPMTYIKARWRSILDNYLKVKIYADSISDFTEAMVKNKFMDGTLSFLEGEVDLFLDHHTAKSTKTPHKGQNLEEEPSDDDGNSYVVDIKDSLHEEVDLDDEDSITVQVKEEVGNTEYGDNNTDTIKDTNMSDQTLNKIKEEPSNTWSEEELLNATRLTKEMIDQLILIKTRKYYMSPAVAK